MVRRTALSVALFLSAFFVAGCSMRASSTGAPSAAGLVGSWRSHVQFDGGLFAEVKDLELLYVFNAGGTMVESSNYDAVPPVPPSYGVWREVAPRQYEAKYFFFMTKAPAGFDEIAKGGGWLPAGHGVLTEKITLAADDSLESAIDFNLFDKAGNPIPGGGKGTGHAVRIRF
jgi:hypothetical protein